MRHIPYWPYWPYWLPKQHGHLAVSPGTWVSASKTEVARLDGQRSNQLFDVLEDWNADLKELLADRAEPSEP